MADTVLAALARLARSILDAKDAEDAVDSMLASLDTELGLSHSALYVMGDSGDRLVAIASRGFSPSGVGAQVVIGQGPYGLAASDGGRSIRFDDLGRDLQYARSVRMHMDRAGVPLEREIEMPALSGTKSLLAVPLVLAGDVVGVLGAESKERGAFSAEHEHALFVAAALIAPKLVALGDSDVEQHGDEKGSASSRALRVRLYAEDDSVFVDEEYIIKGVPGAILARMLRAHAKDRRDAFSNKELRLDPSLHLPHLKDNLESRLILLRRRLEEKACGVLLERPARGCLRLVVDGELEIVES